MATVYLSLIETLFKQIMPHILWTITEITLDKMYVGKSFIYL